MTTALLKYVLPKWNPDATDYYYYYYGRGYLANRHTNSSAAALRALQAKQDNDSEARFVYKNDETLRNFAPVMAPDCEDNKRNVSWYVSNAADLQDASEKFAQKYGLNGGASNRCFAKFVVRYNNYSAEAYERFVDYVATYLYRDVILHGLCVPKPPKWSESQVSATERIRRKEWVKEKVDIIGTGVFEARHVLDEPPPTAPPSESTHTLNQTWLNDAKAAIETAIGPDEIPYPTPGDALQLYKGIYTQIAGQLKQLEPNDEISFDVLVYYPAHDSTEHCVKNASEYILHGSFKNVNYVVSLRNQNDANATLETTSKIEEHFKKSTKTDQCDLINEINGNTENERVGADGLRALVSTKCARKFVWYELAYQYFQAAYTDAPKVEITPGSKYSNNCGMLVLFP